MATTTRGTRNTTTTMPLDVLLLIALTPAYIWGFRQEMILMVFALAIYLFIAVWQPLTDYESLPDKGGGKWVFLIQWMLILVIISGAAIVPAAKNIIALQTAVRDDNGFTPAYRQYHDGAIQIAAATKFLATGKNPYAETYENSPMRFFGFQAESADFTTNPGIEYLAYLPGYLWLSWPVYKVFTFLSIPYDQRWVYLTLYVLTILALPLLVRKPSLKLTLSIGIGLNPLLVRPITIGMNDVAILLPIVVSILALQRGKRGISAVLFGVACSMKQLAWFLVPFYLLLMSRQDNNKINFQQGVQAAAIIMVVLLIIIGPFVIWDTAAFFEDVFLYPAGRVGGNYPIIGYTIGTILIGLGIIPSHYADFPFWILQAVVGFPLLLLLLRRQWHANTIGEMFLASGLFILGVGMVSRFFQDNYVGFIAILVTLGFCLRVDQGRSSEIYPQ